MDPMGNVDAWSWGIFGALLAVFLTLDLFSHRGDEAESRRSAFVWSIIWIAVGLLFVVFVHWRSGRDTAEDYLAAYLIEKSLSLDNLFVFLLIFRSTRIPERNQRTALTWGIFGALVFRALFIFIGAAAVQRWHWVLYIFGAILLLAAWRAFRDDPSEQRQSRAVEWLSRHIPLTPRLHGNRFIVHEGGRWQATPLLVALLALELTDIVFAVDSVPAAFSVTQNTFIIYSSNAFAILGLRSLYLVLAHTIARMRYLHYGLAAVLAFAGIKIIVKEWVHVSALTSALVIVVCIGSSIIASVRARPAWERTARLPDPSRPRRSNEEKSAGEPS